MPQQVRRAGAILRQAGTSPAWCHQHGLLRWDRDGAVFAATMNGPVLALRAQDGALVWSSNVVHESNGPTVTCADGTVYAAAHVGTPQAESDRYLFALKADNGHVLWRFAADERSAHLARGNRCRYHQTYAAHR
ncbi:MAG TPA: PQQ-binding-like beta-propeller repeat protein [Dehalococcoidia bacterium]|nr:PQQ-binding-like beta-propeller repeat protein [Dehalococcoidia bacterium]